MLQDMLAVAPIDDDFTAQPLDIFVRPAGDNPACRLGAINLAGQSLAFRRNAEIYGEGTPAGYLYKVVSGAVRTCRVLADGRRQIQAFYMPGDVFGFGLESEHTHSAEAIVDSRIGLIRRGAVTALAARDGDVARELWTLTARELQRVQNHAMLLIKTARERVVSFLLEMAERGGNDEPLTLPMSRQDIADYLGLTIETVSRTLTSLESLEAIALPNSRRIVLRDRTALSRLAS
jgi:CRP/FNR family nitrogen fixation transcriptional regulator